MGKRQVSILDHAVEERLIHRPCKNPTWKALNLRCVNFRKKYVVSYLDNNTEIVICEFKLQKVVR